MTCRPSSSSFSMPDRCSSTVHAAVRTRIEVQNGSSTSRISRAAVGPGRFASSQASGKPSTSVISVTPVAIPKVRAKIVR